MYSALEAPVACSPRYNVKTSKKNRDSGQGLIQVICRWIYTYLLLKYMVPATRARPKPRHQDLKDCHCMKIRILCHGVKVMQMDQEGVRSAEFAFGLVVRMHKYLQLRKGETAVRE